MIVLTYLVRTMLLVAIVPLSLLMYAIVKDVMTKENW